MDGGRVDEHKLQFVGQEREERQRRQDSVLLASTFHDLLFKCYLNVRGNLNRYETGDRSIVVIRRVKDSD